MENRENGVSVSFSTRSLISHSLEQIIGTSHPSNGKGMANVQAVQLQVQIIDLKKETGTSISALLAPIRLLHLPDLFFLS